MKNRSKLKTALLLAMAVNSSYAEERCFPPVGEIPTLPEVLECFQKGLDTVTAENQKQQTTINTQQGLIDAQQQQISELEAENQALKTQVEQLSQNQPNQPLTKNCTPEQKGQIRFDGTYGRLCNGTNWQIMDARQSKPVLKPSAKQYTIAEVRETAKDQNWYQVAGQGTICETGYHVCTFMEALVLKYAFPRSRIAYGESGYSIRTLGNYSEVKLAGTTHPHNALLGYNDSEKWNGPSLQCPEGSAPMIHFYDKGSINRGLEWDGGCYKDDKRNWACCLNNLD